MFSGIEVHFPAVNLSDISTETLKKFAELHHDRYTIDGGDGNFVMALIRVIRRDLPEFGGRFHMIDDPDGVYMVFVPSAMGTYSYDEMFEKVYPYLKELGVYGFADYMGVLTAYDDKYFIRK